MKNIVICMLVACFLPLATSSTMPIVPNQSTTSSGNDSLLESIRSYANENDLRPIDATIDRVWKAIPGYNGFVVDIEKSYDRLADQQKFETSQLIWKEVPPTVLLKDLPPSPIYRGNKEKPMVSFLINVAWGDEFLPSILQILDGRNVKATFFLDGSWTKKNPDLAKKIYDHGHEIGNHAYSHPDLRISSDEKTRTELSKTNAVIEETLGVSPKWFGPPSGSFNERTIEIARDLDMLTVLWTVDTVDWKNPDTDVMVNKILNGVENGAMVLMHPTKPTAEGLERMIKGIEEKGLVIGRVSDLLSENRIESYMQQKIFLP